MKKKQMILAALLCAAATVARAGTFLYWEVDVTPEESGEANYAFSYATIKATGTDTTTSSALSLYGPGSSTPSGTKLASSAYPAKTSTTTDGGVFAGLDNYASGAISSFLVELWLEGGTEDTATRVAWGNIAYDTVKSHIYTDLSMSGNPSPYTVTASQVVPEPTSGLLALVGMAALALRRKQTKV